MPSLFGKLLKRLRALAETDRPFAAAAPIQAVAPNRWERKDRRRSVMPYDPDLCGPIQLTWGKEDKTPD